MRHSTYTSDNERLIDPIGREVEHDEDQDRYDERRDRNEERDQYAAKRIMKNALRGELNRWAGSEHIYEQEALQVFRIANRLFGREFADELRNDWRTGR